MRAILSAAATGALLLALAACSRQPAPSDGGKAADRAGHVTIRGDDRIARSLTWDAPQVTLTPETVAGARRRAERALAEGRLYADADSAIPLFLGILRLHPDDEPAQAGLQQAVAALLAAGHKALTHADEEVDDLAEAHRVAAVARTVAPRDRAVQAYLAEVDAADHRWDLSLAAERDLAAGRLGESGGGALATWREVLRLKPGHMRALQGLAAVESGLIRRGEAAAERGDFRSAQRWVALAAGVRPGSSTIADARSRIAAIRSARIGRLHDAGLAALQQPGGLTAARQILADILRISEPGNPEAAELRQRIELATHYGLFRPGQAFTDGLGLGARGPEMVVVPHGAFLMGAADAEPGATDSERPAHYIRFDRGFAMSRTEVTVGQFARFVAATGYRPTATRRGFSLMYEERSGNFVRSSGVDWHHAYDGTRAADTLPVVHVSARDADAYAKWLSKQSGQHYRLPSEAEFEYALRAGGAGRFPWGNGAPPPGAGNLTGSLDRSPGGRSWSNAFAGYRDGYWGPAPVGRFAVNPYGLHDLAGNVSEWIADCWHDGYRRAPKSGAAWINPGCRTRVTRGGAWASAPVQTRSAWRAPAGFEATSARTGFRVVRGL